MNNEKPEEIEIHTIKDVKTKNTTQCINPKNFFFDFKNETIMVNIKNYLRFIIKHPECSKFISLINSLLQIYLFFAIMTFCFQTVPQFNDTPQKENFWIISEAIFTIIFTTEYFVRLFAYPFRKKYENKSKLKSILKFIKKKMNIIDIVSLIPFYLETIFPSIFSGYGNPMTLIIRSLKLFRLFRIFSHSNKFSLQIQIVSQAFIQSKDGLIILIWAFGISIIFFSTLFYIAETSHCHYDEVEKYWYTKETYLLENKDMRESCIIQSIVGAFWWACVTIATVGYGDLVPQTIAGKIISGITMTCALLISSIPVTILSYNLSNLYSTYQDKKDVIKKEGSSGKLKILKLLTDVSKCKEEGKELNNEPQMKPAVTLSKSNTCFFGSVNSDPKIPQFNSGSFYSSTTSLNAFSADITEKQQNNNVNYESDLTDNTFNLEKNVVANSSEKNEQVEKNKKLLAFTLKQYNENIEEIHNLTNKLTKLQNLNAEYEAIIKSYEKKNI